MDTIVIPSLLAMRMTTSALVVMSAATGWGREQSLREHALQPLAEPPGSPIHLHSDPSRLRLPRDVARSSAVVAELMSDTCGATDGVGRPPTLASLGLSPAQMWTEAPLCNLVSAPDAAPHNYCKQVERSFCKWAIDGTTNDHYKRLCDSGGDTKLLFDQYSLERTMLGKWLNASQLCTAPECVQQANFVIVPSFLFHCFTERGGPDWQLVTSDARLDRQRAYWNRIRTGTTTIGGGRALIVVQQSFTPDSEATQGLLSTLAEQPANFASRVVIASLESNLKREHKLSLSQYLYHGSTSAWLDDASHALRVRSSQVLWATSIAAELRQPGPLLVSLPYPTGLYAAAFARPSPGYSAKRVRPVMVLMLGKHIPKSRNGSQLRNALWDQMSAAGGKQPDRQNSFAGCPPKHADCPLPGTPSIMLCAEGDEGCHNTHWESLHDVTANSAFCLQPAGDTLTRSHLYVSILSGCIPVIFGPSRRGDYDEASDAAWAWRAAGRSSSHFVNYSEFTVTVPLGRDETPTPTFLAELMAMPKRDPHRYQALREGLDKVSPLMRYTPWECDGVHCEDAFSHFTRLLEVNQGLLDAAAGANAAKLQSRADAANLEAATAGKPTVAPKPEPTVAPKPEPTTPQEPMVKVYVLPVAPALTDDLLSCYRQRRGADPWDDTKPQGNCESSSSQFRSCVGCQRGNMCSASLGVETAQHSSDVWLHKGLLNHASRTMDPEAADVVFVPFYGAVSYELGDCRGVSHRSRIELLAETMRNSPLWAAKGKADRPGRRFALPITHWRIAATLTSPLRELLESSQAVTLTQDPYFFDQTRGLPNMYGDSSWMVPGWGCRAFNGHFNVIVPYPANYGNVLTPLALKEHEHRPQLVQFRGNTKLSLCAARTRMKVQPPASCGLRSQLVEAASQRCPSADLKLEAIGRTNENHFAFAANFSTSQQTASMRRSTFCLIPRGDTPSSRRLYDAVAAGCIPVVISDELPGQLPYQHDLNWSSFTHEVAEELVMEDACALFDSLRHMPPWRVHELQANLRKARRQLIYGEKSPTSLGFQPGGATDLALAAMHRAISNQGAGGECAVSSLSAGHAEERYALAAGASAHPLLKGAVQPGLIKPHQGAHGLIKVPHQGSSGLIRAHPGSSGLVQAVASAKPQHVIPLKANPKPGGSDIFIIFSRPRSSSSTLCDHLNQQPDVTMFYELFSPDANGPGIADARRRLGYPTHSSARNDVSGLMTALSAYCPTRLCGFKVFDHHLDEDEVVRSHLEELFAWSANRSKPTKMVMLKRKDSAKEYASVKKALETGNWGTTPCLQQETKQDTKAEKGYTATPKPFEKFELEKKKWFNTVRSLSPQHGPLLALEMETFIHNQKDTTLRTLNFLGVNPAEKVELLAPWDFCPEKNHTHEKNEN